MITIVSGVNRTSFIRCQSKEGNIITNENNNNQLTGERMGLDFFLSDREMVGVARTFGGQSFLLPLNEDDKSIWNYNFIYLRDKNDNNQFKSLNINDGLAKGGAQISLNQWYQNYANDPLFMKSTFNNNNNDNANNDNNDSRPCALRPPPVPNLVCYYGLLLIFFFFWFHNY